MRIFGREVFVAMAVLALLAPPRAAEAQFRRVELLGARVRVTAPPVRADRVTGQVTRYDNTGLVVRDEATGSEQVFPLQSVSLLEIYRGSSRGSHARQRATLLAFVVGGLGAIAGAAVQPFKDVGTGIAVGAGGGALLGAGIGAAWGSSSTGERWEMAVRPWGYRPGAPLPPPAPPPPDSTVAQPAPRS